MHAIVLPLGCVVQEVGRVAGSDFQVDTYNMEGEEGEGCGRVIVLQVTCMNVFRCDWHARHTWDCHCWYTRFISLFPLAEEQGVREGRGCIDHQERTDFEARHG